MGRGRAKAKQVKVARQLKYSGGGMDLDQLRAEFGVGADRRDGDDHAAYAELANRYSVDDEDEDQDDLDDYDEEDPDDEDFDDEDALDDEDDLDDEDFDDEDFEDDEDEEDGPAGAARMSRAAGN
jgi:Protein of unknown function (DUF3073)